MRPLPTHLAPYRVYGDAASGNCHKVKLVLELLGLPYRWHAVDVLSGETRSPEFLARNSNGKVPVLQIDEHTFLAESNAILCYLAEGTDLWPGDRLQRAQTLAWMFFEQNEHEPNIAGARFACVYLKQPEHPRLPALRERGYAALATMQRHLAARSFFVGASLGIADLALFAYTHKAHEGGFDLAPYPAVQAWLQRCLATPGVTAMPSR